LSTRDGLTSLRDSQNKENAADEASQEQGLNLENRSQGAIQPARDKHTT